MSKVLIERELLRKHVAEIDSWNASMEKIIGRQPGYRWASLETMRDLLSRQTEQHNSCKWVRDDETGCYGTACGVTWHLSDGGEPEEHGQYYCHHCGKQIDDE